MKDQIRENIFLFILDINDAIRIHQLEMQLTNDEDELIQLQQSIDEWMIVKEELFEEFLILMHKN